MIWSKALDFSAKASRSSVSAGIKELHISVTTAMCITVGNLESREIVVSRKPGRTNVSLLLWLLLTWSFGCIGCFDPNSPPRSSIALLEMTWSRTFLHYELKELIIIRYLICVHVTLGSAASLEDNQWKMVNKFPWNHLRMGKIFRTKSLGWLWVVHVHHQQLSEWLHQFSSPCHILRSLLKLPSSRFQRPWSEAMGGVQSVHQCQSFEETWSDLKFDLEKDSDPYLCVCAPQYLSEGTCNSPKVSFSMR